jgi:hypothetical protein
VDRERSSVNRWKPDTIRPVAYSDGELDRRRLPGGDLLPGVPEPPRSADGHPRRRGSRAPARRRIIRGDFDEEYFSPLPKIQLDVYREALLICYGKVSVYLRAIDRPLPGQWLDWIG